MINTILETMSPFMGLFIGLSLITFCTVMLIDNKYLYKGLNLVLILLILSTISALGRLHVVNAKANTTMTYIQKNPNDNEYLNKNFNALKQITESKNNTNYKTTIYEDEKNEFYLIDRENLETNKHNPVEIIKQDSTEEQNLDKLLSLRRADN